jgi:aspartate aminotransferase
LANEAATTRFLTDFKKEIWTRLHGIYQGFEQLKAEGFNVHCIEPKGAIYLTVSFDLKGKTTAAGKVLNNTEDVTAYILGEAKLAMVPFSAFGASKDSPWFRLSVGTCKKEGIGELFERLRAALAALK